tara:strand:+ start:849 stop:1136 length:288 start_codon:yes stop_codon:yes gene_type:complete
LIKFSCDTINKIGKLTDQIRTRISKEKTTYKAVDGVFKKIESILIDQDWNTKICFTKVYKENEFGELKLVSTSCSKTGSQGDWIKVDCKLSTEKF